MRQVLFVLAFVVVSTILTGNASPSLSSNGASNYKGQERVIKPPSSVLERTSRIAEFAIPLYPSGIMPTFSAEIGGKARHRPNQNAIFTAMFYSAQFLSTYEIHRFFGSARLFYSGDIVVATDLNVSPEVLNLLFHYEVIVYKIPTKCTKNKHISWMTDCKFLDDAMSYVPKAQLRYYLYQQWAAHYSRGVHIMTTDSRDVIFQSNPFSYRAHEWRSADLVVFLETHPFKTIKRCFWNSRWIRECYSDRGLNKIGRHVVSCSGVTIGTRDAILVYVSYHNRFNNFKF